MLSKISQLEEDKYHIISLICGILKKKKKLKDTENRLVVARGLACVKWIKRVKKVQISS